MQYICTLFFSSMFILRKALRVAWSLHVTPFAKSVRFRIWLIKAVAKKVFETTFHLDVHKIRKFKYLYTDVKCMPRHVSECEIQNSHIF